MGITANYWTNYYCRATVAHSFSSCLQPGCLRGLTDGLVIVLAPALM